MISRRELRNVKGSMKCLSRHRNKTSMHLNGSVSMLSTKSPISIHALFHITTRFLSLSLSVKPTLNVTSSRIRSVNFY
jgi:hypothetical protein